VVDVQGFNYWNGGLPDSKSHKQGAPKAADIDAFHRQFPKQPCIGTEMANGDSTRGIYEEDPARGHVAGYKAGCLDCIVESEVWWPVFDKRAFLSGGFTWVGFDYRGEPNPYDHVCISSQSGIVDTCGFPKDVFYYYKSWWGVEPVLHLFPHWNWSGREGSKVNVRCYSNLDSVELFVNGKSMGSKAMARNSHLTWVVHYEPGAIEARGSKNRQVVLVDRRETTGTPAKLALRANRSTLAADRKDTSAITIEVQDFQGRIMPTASNKVHLKLTGPGKIIGVGNGDPGCHEADRPDAPDVALRSAFNGLCLVLVQASNQTGTIRLEASADGLVSAAVEINNVAAAVSPRLA